ncbi:UNVERIFIED_CONTAM: pimeloyl-ACP methyl ester carboxylesterase [Williamsia faeni]
MQTIAGLRTHVVVDGSGPPLLYLAALGGNWFDFDQATALLRDRWTILRYDRPGYGFSDPLPTGEIPSIFTEVDRIDHILDVLGIIKPVVVVGHSLASLYAEAYARSRPERVAGLIMLDGSYVTMPLQLVPPRWSNRFAHVAATAVNRLPLPRVAGVFAHRTATYPGPPAGFDNVQKKWIAEVFNSSAYPRALIVEQSGFGVMNSELVGLRRTAELLTPTLVVSALPGRRTPFGCFWDWKQRRYAAHLGADYLALRPARHYFLVHQPKVAAQVIDEFADRAIRG